MACARAVRLADRLGKEHCLSYYPNNNSKCIAYSVGYPAGNSRKGKLLINPDFTDEHPEAQRSSITCSKQCSHQVGEPETYPGSLALEFMLLTTSLYGNIFGCHTIMLGTVMEEIENRLRNLQTKSSYLKGDLKSF